MVFGHIGSLVRRAREKMDYSPVSTDLKASREAVWKEFGEKYGFDGAAKGDIREAAFVAIFKNPVENTCAPALVPSEDCLVLLGKRSAGASWAPGHYAPLGGGLDAADFKNAATREDVISNALKREVQEEAKIAPDKLHAAYVGSFCDKKSGFLVHAFSGFLTCDPEHDSEQHHLSQVSIVPDDDEHENFSWVPVRKAMKSRTVHAGAKHVIRRCLRHHAGK